MVGSTALPHAPYATSDYESTSRLVDFVGAVAFDGVSAIDEPCGLGVRITESFEHSPVVQKYANATFTEPLKTADAGSPFAVACGARHGRKFTNSKRRNLRRCLSVSARLPSSQKLLSVQECPLHCWVDSVFRKTTPLGDDFVVCNTKNKNVGFAPRRLAVENMHMGHAVLQKVQARTKSKEPGELRHLLAFHERHDGVRRIPKPSTHRATRPSRRLGPHAFFFRRSSNAKRDSLGLRLEFLHSMIVGHLSHGVKS